MINKMLVLLRASITDIVHGGIEKIEYRATAAFGADGEDEGHEVKGHDNDENGD